MKYCKYCGSKILYDDRFCHDCMEPLLDLSGLYEYPSWEFDS